MSNGTLFHFDEGRKNFEDLAKPNGSNWWTESDLMEALDYSSTSSFRSVLLKAQQACLSLGIAIEDSFRRLEDGSYEVTRFGCYLIAMNGDPKKKAVASAQIYFAVLAETFQHHYEHAENIDRVMIRDEVTEGEKSLASVAKHHGVEKYPFFQNAGYRGMYNMNISDLKQRKGLPSKAKVIDYMGKQEIAAHLFRITQTTAKIENENIQGQKPLEKAARQVGQQVRNTMVQISGQRPEHLPPAEKIQDVKKALKETKKKLKD